MIGIYKISNTINNKVYIGKSTNIEKRFRQHQNKSYRQEKHQAIHRAIDKYGVENFKFEVLEECGADIINNREKYWIGFYNSYEEGYNCTLGGDGTASGNEHPTAILTEDDVNKIWDMRERGMTVKEIQKEIGICSIACIQDIFAKRTWVYLYRDIKIQNIKNIKLNLSDLQLIKNKVKDGYKPMAIYNMLIEQGKNISINTIRNYCCRFRKEI